MMELEAGGGGYYGGHTNNYSGHSAGAGGSGYVSGHSGCIAVTSQEDTTPKASTYSQISDSYHYSGKIFKNTVLTAGNSSMPTWDGTTTMVGNGNSGYAKITALSAITTYPVSNITVDNGEMNESFNPSCYEYYVKVDKNKPIVYTTITTTDEGVVVENGKVQQITTKVGTTLQEIKVIDAYGLEYTYKIHFEREASEYSDLDGITIDGKEIADFKPNVYDYTVTLPYDAEKTAILDLIKARPEQEVQGIGEIDVSHNSALYQIEVLSEDKEHTSIYNITINRTPTTKLKELHIEKNEDIDRIFESDTYEYNFEVTTGTISLNINPVPYDEDARVTIKGAGYIKEGRNKVTITVSREGVADSVYTLNVQKGESLGQITYDYDYTGDYQVFVAPAVGYYKFECWGAAGGASLCNGRKGSQGGLGGYTSGIIKLNEGDTFYIYVGQQGEDGKYRSNTNTSWNGGGLGTWDSSDNEASGAGGGATDIRLVKGQWNSEEGLNSRLMVAGAGRRKIMELYTRSRRRTFRLFSF